LQYLCVKYLVWFATNRFALTKPASMGWRNVGIRLKFPSVQQINLYIVQ